MMLARSTYSAASSSLCAINKIIEEVDMAEDWEQDKINGWLAKGMLSKDFIMKRLDQNIQHSFAINDKDKPAFERVFKSICTDDDGGLLTEAAFISLLQTKMTLPQSREGVKVGKILYASLAYLSTLPFPSSPEKASTSQPRGLSLTQLTRSLVWMLPERYKYFIEQGPDSRARTKADHRRLIFQSFACTFHNEPYDPERARQLALRNTLDVYWEGNDEEFSFLNHDSDGDEIYHDLLDVLYSTQEVKHVWLACVLRNSFRPVAKRIASENELASLHSLGIPADHFVYLAKFLLALQFDPAQIGVVEDLDQFDSAAQSLCAAFCEQHKNPAATVITWPMFNHGLRNVAPYLFDPLYQMLYIALFDRDETPEFITGSDPPSTVAGSILTLPRMSQLSSFLIGCAYFGDFRRFQHYTSLHPRPTPTEFVSAMEAVPNEGIVVLSGTEATTGETFIFGVFSPKPKLDGSSVQTSVAPGWVGLEPCSIFQLAPVQDIFRGVTGKPGWTVETDAVIFGQKQGGGSGVVMGLKDSLRRAEITHRVSEGDDDAKIYEPNPWRGNWAVNIEISQIEIWSEEE